MKTKQYAELVTTGQMTLEHALDMIVAEQIAVYNKRKGNLEAVLREGQQRLNAFSKLTGVNFASDAFTVLFRHCTGRTT